MPDYLFEYQLPSRGHFYGGKVPDGIITLQPWGSKEQKLMAGAERIADSLWDRLVTASIASCPIPAAELILQDRISLLIAARASSYGAAYEFQYRCSDCRQPVGEQIDLKVELKTIYAEEDWQEPFEVRLPLQGKVLAVRYLRGTDQEAVARYARALTQRGVKADGDLGYDVRMARRIVMVDGKKLDIQDAILLVQSLRGADDLEFRQSIEEREFGVDLELHLKCKNCAWPNDVIMPLDRDFFHPRRKRGAEVDPLGAELLGEARRGLE